MEKQNRNQHSSLRENDFITYLELYEEHYENLLIYTFLNLKDEQKARLAVRIAFQTLWNSPDRWLQEQPAYAILFREVRETVYFLKTSWINFNIATWLRSQRKPAFLWKIRIAIILQPDLPASFS